MRSLNRPQKITTGEMREMGVPSVLVYAPTTDAAIRSPSAPIAGRITSDCLNLKSCGIKGADLRPDFN
jgi:hypothetical protein